MRTALTKIRLTEDPAPDEAFAWDPSGDLIAYVSYRHGAKPEDIGIGDAEIFVVDVRTGETTNLSRNPAWDGDPDWSPDGTRIVFTRRTDHGEIYVMRSDGSEQERLPGSARGPRERLLPSVATVAGHSSRSSIAAPDASIKVSRTWSTSSLVER